MGYARRVMNEFLPIIYSRMEREHNGAKTIFHTGSGFLFQAMSGLMIMILPVRDWSEEDGGIPMWHMQQDASCKRATAWSYF